MDDAALNRYSRHLLLNEWGIEAQNKLALAKVLIIGMGGLGCPAAHTLAAAGVGSLTIADGDTVDVSNLQRQYLHTPARIGTSKVLSAQIALNEVNPLCTVNVINARLAGAALLEAIRAHDLVLDCSDNFATRHAINRACVACHTPLISGAAIRFDGQLIMFNAADSRSACYHCLFAEHNTPEQGQGQVDTEESEDRCAVTGVFAPLTQQVGTLQAATALRWITGVGRVNTSELTIFNALNAAQHTIKVPKDSGCAVCSASTHSPMPVVL